MPPRSEQERTEPATPRKREDARKQGQVARSRELPSAAVLLGGILVLSLAGGAMAGGLMDLWRDLLSRSGELVVSPESLSQMIAGLTWKFVLLVGPMILALALVVVAVHLAQVGFFLTGEAISPKFSRINPLEGFRRFLSVQSLVELLKALLKLAIVAYVAWRTVAAEWETFLLLSDVSPWTVATHLGQVVLRIGLRTGLVLVALGLLDYLYQRWEHERGLRMTKDEVKEEYKQREGDPKIKAKIRQKQREMARRRMMAAVPKADVVITNPQHLAIALQYDRSRMAAPTVVAKGAGFIAQRIREVARAHGVEMVENRPLAQALYKGVDVGGQIPANLYRAVAEILAHVFRSKNGQRSSTQYGSNKANRTYSSPRTPNAQGI
jgi:flagellar biosynthesis protein FlhB